MSMFQLQSSKRTFIECCSKCSNEKIVAKLSALQTNHKCTAGRVKISARVNF